LAPRRAALGILLTVRRGLPFDTALERGLRGLPEIDRRLAHELTAGVLRQEAELDAALAPLIPRGLSTVDGRIREVLRLGAYQLRHLERVPAHAAVTTAVELARETAGERVTGFVNAVLRRLPREGGAAAAPKRSPSQRLATAWSHPEWLVARWVERFGEDDTERLLEWNNQHPPLVVQPARLPIAELESRFTAAAVRYFPAPYHAGLVVDESKPDRLPGYADGWFLVQDPSQALVTRFAGVPPGATAFDACAAPGGKSLRLAATAGMVVAADLARRRLPRLRDNVRRAGRENIHVLLADAAHPPIRPVDFVLLDAPCLGTGTFARHPDARLRVQPEALTRLAQEQGLLLDAAADRVRPGGVLCYATCSLEPEENAAQVDAFLARHPAYRREPVSGEFPVNAAGDLEVLPHRDGMDGAYAARLVKSGAA
jgi:16S rRNA (cytosine967-C5)-methyltransferase